MAPAYRGSSRGNARNETSSQLAEILNPAGGGMRHGSIRPGSVPDHSRNNRAAVKKASLENRLRKMRSKEEEQLPGPPPRRRSGSSTYDSDTRLVEVSRRDFLLENALNVATAREHPASRNQHQSDERQWLTKAEYGVIPQYLQKLKLEMAGAQAEKQVAREAALMPAGMRLLPDEEREALLCSLIRSKRDAESTLQALPFNVETHSQRKYKKVVEARLTEVEKAIRIFSNRKVLVQAEPSARCSAV